MKLKKDQKLGIGGLLVSAFFAYQTLQLPASNYVGDPGPQMFPLIGCFLLAVCSIYVIVFPKKDGEPFLEKHQLKAAAGLFFIYVLAIVMFWLLGFEITAAVLLFVVTYIFSGVSNKNASKKTRLIQSLIYSAAGTVALYLIYKLALQAQLPTGLLWKLIK